MKNRPYYFVLFTAFIISFCLLTVSYSAYSGVNNEASINKVRENNFLITYNEKDTLKLNENNELDFAITNRDPRSRALAIYLVEIGNKESSDIYYSLNNGNYQLLTKDPLIIAEFSPFGEENDFQFFHLQLKGSSNMSLEYKIKIVEIDKTTNEPAEKPTLEEELFNDSY